MKYKLDFHGVPVIVNPDKDIQIAAMVKNPSFYEEKQMKGYNLYVRSEPERKFFYAVKWDLTSESDELIYVLSKPEAQKVLTTILKNDYLGQMVTRERKIKYSKWGLKY